MANLDTIQNVLSGSAEYSVTALAKAATPQALAANDAVLLRFDNDFVVDEILINGFGDANVGLELYIHQPSGSQIMISPDEFTVTGPSMASTQSSLV